MRLARLTGSAALCITIAILAACGGGGGGGSITPPGTGGNGGATATPTAKPTGSPTGTPTSTPTPALTPTPAPTAPPTAPPTPTPSPSPSTGTLLDCHPSECTVGVGNGQINGTDDQILTSAPNTHGNSGEGDLMPGDPGAAPGGGGQGPLNSTVDNIPCASQMSNDYHVHFFLGLVYYGTEIAIPDATGMVNSYGDYNTNGNTNMPGYPPNFEIYADCYYYTHTHDASGMVHLEAPAGFNGATQCGQIVNWNPPCNYSIFSFANYLDVWGISLTANNFGPFTGPVQIYTTPQQMMGCGNGPNCYTASTTYSLYTGDPRTIQLYSHMAIWIVIGPQPSAPDILPNVEWFNGAE